MKPNYLAPIFAIVASTFSLAAVIPHDGHDLLAREVHGSADTLPDGWSVKGSGCFIDAILTRSLHGAAYVDDSLTPEKCVAFCNAKGFTVAGTEYSRECYCGMELQMPYEAENCNMKCSGSEQMCGGSNRLSVYEATKKIPVTNPGVNSFQSLGCYSDSISASTLSDMVPVEGGPSAMSVALCTSTCKDMGFTYSGLEYAGECWCGNSIQNNAALVPSDLTTMYCDLPCFGNVIETCGGSSRLNLYQLPQDIEFIKQGNLEKKSTGRWHWMATNNNSPDQGYGWENLKTELRKTKSTHGGEYSWSIYPEVDHNEVPRSACMGTFVDIKKPGTYKFSAYIGREDVNSTTKGSPMSYDVFLAWHMKVASGAVCNDRANTAGPCTANAVNGIPAYNLVNSTFTVEDEDEVLGNQLLSICATFPSPGPGMQEYFNVDDVSLLGPN